MFEVCRDHEVWYATGALRRLALPHEDTPHLRDLFKTEALKRPSKSLAMHAVTTDRTVNSAALKCLLVGRAEFNE